MIRFVIITAALFVIIFTIVKLIGIFGKDKNSCPECDGKGYWYGLRERELCKRCKGTGRIEN